MTILSDHGIRQMFERGRLGINPFDNTRVQPCSYDLTLGDVLLVGSLDDWPEGAIQFNTARLQFRPVFVDALEGWRLSPGRLYLAATAEQLTIPDDLVGHLHGRSTAARAGVQVHQQAGLLDPGYCGCPTLEITVVYPTVLEPGDSIAQVTFEQLSGPVDAPYHGRYQGDRMPQPGRCQEKTS